jgi:hypothetical protein
MLAGNEGSTSWRSVAEKAIALQGPGRLKSKSGSHVAPAIVTTANTTAHIIANSLE